MKDRRFGRYVRAFCALAVAAVCAFGAAACGDGGEMEVIGGDSEVKYTAAKDWGAEKVYTYSFDAIGNAMPIGGFAGPFEPSAPSFNGQVQPNFLDDKYWQLFQDCGMNMVVFTRNEYREQPSAVRRALDQAEKYGMLYFVRDTKVSWLTPETAHNLDSLVSEYIEHPGCGGIYGMDEPKASDFARLKSLKIEFDKGEYEDKGVYINMLPVYATSSAFGEYKTYDAFLRGYMEEVKMPYLSYDYYPFQSVSDTLDTISLSRYFSNIATVRKVAEDYGVPFWGFIQAGAQWYGESGTPHMTEYPLYPSESAFDWNINTMLAYGMKGMQYFDAIQDPVLEEINIAEEPNNGRNYTRFGLIGALGNVNQWYYYAVNIAKQIRAAEDVLMNARNMGVIAVGERAKALGSGAEIFADGKWRELTQVSADNAIVGCFDYRGRTALYAVNNSIDQKQQIKLCFDDKYGYDVVQRGTTASVAAKTLTLTLEAGEGALVTLRAE